VIGCGAFHSHRIVPLRHWCAVTVASASAVAPAIAVTSAVASAIAVASVVAVAVDAVVSDGNVGPSGCGELRPVSCCMCGFQQTKILGTDVHATHQQSERHLRRDIERSYRRLCCHVRDHPEPREHLTEELEG
jgi:hypothetical protein